MASEVDVNTGHPRFLWRASTDGDLYFSNLESLMWHCVFGFVYEKQMVEMIDVQKLFEGVVDKFSVPIAMIERGAGQFCIVGDVPGEAVKHAIDVMDVVKQTRYHFKSWTVVPDRLSFCSVLAQYWEDSLSKNFQLNPDAPLTFCRADQMPEFMFDHRPLRVYVFGDRNSVASIEGVCSKTSVVTVVEGDIFPLKDATSLMTHMSPSRANKIVDSIVLNRDPDVPLAALCAVLKQCGAKGVLHMVESNEEIPNIEFAIPVVFVKQPISDIAFADRACFITGVPQMKSHSRSTVIEPNVEFTPKQIDAEAPSMPPPPTAPPPLPMDIHQDDQMETASKCDLSAAPPSAPPPLPEDICHGSPLSIEQQTIPVPEAVSSPCEESDHLSSFVEQEEDDTIQAHLPEVEESESDAESVRAYLEEVDVGDAVEEQQACEQAAPALVETIFINVKFVQKQNTFDKFETTLATTVLEFKQMLQALCDINVEDQYLLFSGSKLQDDMTLEEVGVEPANGAEQSQSNTIFLVEYRDGKAIPHEHVQLSASDCESDASSFEDSDDEEEADEWEMVGDKGHTALKAAKVLRKFVESKAGSIAVADGRTIPEFFKQHPWCKPFITPQDGPSGAINIPLLKQFVKSYPRFFVYSERQNSSDMLALSHHFEDRDEIDMEGRFRLDDFCFANGYTTAVFKNQEYAKFIYQSTFKHPVSGKRLLKIGRFMIEAKKHRFVKTGLFFGWGEAGHGLTREILTKRLDELLDNPESVLRLVPGANEKEKAIANLLVKHIQQNYDGGVILGSLFGKWIGENHGFREVIGEKKGSMQKFVLKFPDLLEFVPAVPGVCTASIKLVSGSQAGAQKQSEENVVKSVPDQSEKQVAAKLYKYIKFKHDGSMIGGGISNFYTTHAGCQEVISRGRSKGALRSFINLFPNLFQCKVEQTTFTIRTLSASMKKVKQETSDSGRNFIACRRNGKRFFNTISPEEIKKWYVDAQKEFKDSSMSKTETVKVMFQIMIPDEFVVSMIGVGGECGKVLKTMSNCQVAFEKQENMIHDDKLLLRKCVIEGHFHNCVRAVHMIQKPMAILSGDRVLEKSAAYVAILLQDIQQTILDNGSPSFMQKVGKACGVTWRWIKSGRREVPLRLDVAGPSALRVTHAINLIYRQLQELPVRFDVTLPSQAASLPTPSRSLVEIPRAAADDTPSSAGSGSGFHGMEFKLVADQLAEYLETLPGKTVFVGTSSHTNLNSFFFQFPMTEEIIKSVGVRGFVKKFKNRFTYLAPVDGTPRIKLNSFSAAQELAAARQLREYIKSVGGKLRADRIQDFYHQHPKHKAPIAAKTMGVFVDSYPQFFIIEEGEHQPTICVRTSYNADGAAELLHDFLLSKGGEMVLSKIMIAFYHEDPNAHRLIQNQCGGIHSFISQYPDLFSEVGEGAQLAVKAKSGNQCDEHPQNDSDTDDEEGFYPSPKVLNQSDDSDSDFDVPEIRWRSDIPDDVD